MATLSLQLPAEYGYVLVAATSSIFVNLLHFVLTAGARKRSGIDYPNAYATPEQAAKNPAAYAFNCAQRAHANYTESITPFMGALLISGLSYPTYAAGLGITWTTGRVLYAIGYTSSAGPKGRVVGSAVSSLALIGLMGFSVASAIKFLPK
ncbi:MAPEG family protein [Microdochium nivale]|nr:MAPEG family protein [Microdochium nivale]